MLNIAGRDLAREGAAMLDTLYPDASTHREVSARLEKRFRALIDSNDPHKMAVGFFLFGVSEAARGGKIGD